MCVCVCVCTFMYKFMCLVAHMHLYKIELGIAVAFIYTFNILTFSISCHTDFFKPYFEYNMSVVIFIMKCFRNAEKQRGVLIMSTHEPTIQIQHYYFPDFLQISF